MKKLTKKIWAVALAVVMVLAMTVTAMAATTVTINPQTPTGATNTPTYTYYVMMKASVGTTGTAYYVENETLANALDGLKVGESDLFTVTKASGAERWNVVINGSFSGEQIAAALQTIKDNAIATGTATANVITLDYDGYILIESSLGTNLVVDTVTTKEINEKNAYPSITKTENRQNAEIGQEVTYEIKVTIPATVEEKSIKVVDTISDGLTLNAAITADNDITGLAWTVRNDGKYEVTIPAATVKANAGKIITLTYKATVNEKAVVNKPESNKAHLEYDNFVSTETTEVTVTTFGFELAKVNGSAEALAGVKFTLTNSANEYYTVPSNANSVDEDRFVSTKSEVVTDENGKVVFAGLAEGTYTLTETETLTGYNILTSPITVTIDANGTATFVGAEGTGNVVTVVNNTGSALPSTGGIGTTMFYVIGAILVLGAGVLLVTRRRMSAK